MPSALRLIPCAVVVAALTLVQSAGGVATDSTPPVITLTLSGTPGENGWYAGPAVVAWKVDDPESTPIVDSGCLTRTLARDTSGTTESCSAHSAGGSASQTTKLLRIDQTPPEIVDATPARVPDRDGWYSRPVTIEFGGRDSTSGIESCTAAVYKGPDVESASLTGVCRDRAGNASRPLVFTLKYDATPPEVTGLIRERPPDHNGWYNHPVTFTFDGDDGVSGIGECSVVKYSGPDRRAASVRGTCMDAAGNRSEPRSFGLRYDAAPPVPGRARMEPGDRRATIRWRPLRRGERVAVMRSQAVPEGAERAVYQGRGRRYTDRGLRNGVRYRYVVTVYDQAGNSNAESFELMPSGPLRRPREDARVSSPPLLVWTPVEEADFYNVQLMRGSRKILSAWPTRSRLRLRVEWTYGGRTYRLAPGRYRWYVWPGFDGEVGREFGEQLGSSTFVVAPRE